MPKFSIIIPVYNVEKYLSDCLNSVKNQTYKDFEVIIVNDGSKDNSQSIIDEFIKHDNRFKSYKKINGGQSSARNYGVEKVTGEYILFVDSDDTIESNLLEEINKLIIKNDGADLVRFQIRKINTDINNIHLLKGSGFQAITGEEAFSNFLNDELFDSPCLYAYKTSFYKKNNFEFVEGKIHEDFGLIPYIIVKANKVIATDYCGYNYMIRNNSVMTNKDNKHLIKRMNDMFYHYDHLYQIITDDNEISIKTKKIFYSFLANAIYNIGDIIPKEAWFEYKSFIKKRKVWNGLRTDTFIRWLKKIYAHYFFELYMKFVIGRGR